MSELSVYLDRWKTVTRLIMETIDVKGYSLSEVSIKMGMNRAYLSEFLRGKAPHRLDDLRRKSISQILNINESDLYIPNRPKEISSKNMILDFVDDKDWIKERADIMSRIDARKSRTVTYPAISSSAISNANEPSKEKVVVEVFESMVIAYPEDGEYKAHSFRINTEPSSFVLLDKNLYKTDNIVISFPDDSMEPDYRKGELVVLDRVNELPYFHDVAVKLNDHFEVGVLRGSEADPYLMKIRDATKININPRDISAAYEIRKLGAR